MSRLEAAAWVGFPAFELIDSVTSGMVPTSLHLNFLIPRKEIKKSTHHTRLLP